MKVVIPLSGMESSVGKIPKEFVHVKDVVNTIKILRLLVDELEHGQSYDLKALATVIDRERKSIENMCISLPILPPLPELPQEKEDQQTQ